VFDGVTKSFHQDDQETITMPGISRWQLRQSQMALLSQRSAGMFTPMFKVTQTHFLSQSIFTTQHVFASQKTSGRRSPNLVPSINLSCNSKQDIPSAEDGNTSPCLPSLIRHALRRIKGGSTSDRSVLLFVALRATLWDGHLISTRVCDWRLTSSYTATSTKTHK
jgi:hypothetical protein